MASNLQTKPRLVILAGPTGVGKTNLSIQLAEKHQADVIGADSVQVYRYLDIGSAKPSPAEMDRVPHHMVDLVDPDQDFDAARYAQTVRPLIHDLGRRGRRALVVGGTGFYLRSLNQGLFPGPGRDDRVRAEIRAEARQSGREAVHRQLARVDPEAAARIDPRDLVRIERALEVHRITGRPISSFHREHGLAEAPFEVLFIVITAPRPELYDRIARRTEAMFRQGLVDEVKSLIDRGYHRDLKSMRSIGYRETAALIDGEIDTAEAKNRIVTNTRRLAKRQLTWFRAQPGVVWAGIDQTERVDRLVQDFWTADGAD